MEMPLSELADRLTILRLKIERLPEDNTMANQFAIFNAEVQKQLARFPDDIREQIQHEIAILYEENAKTWDLEFDIRRGELNEDHLEEIGRRALLIRKSNARRLRRKNKIARLSCDMTMWDRKVDHGSE